MVLTQFVLLALLEKMLVIFNCITTIESCIDHCCPLEEALENAGENVYKAAFRLARSIQLGQKMRH